MVIGCIGAAVSFVASSQAILRNGLFNLTYFVGDLYRQRIAAIEQLLTEHGTLGMRKSYDYISIIPVPHDKVRAKDHIRAAENDQVFIEAPDGSGLILAYRYLAAVMRLSNPADEAAHSALRTLGLRPGLAAYEFHAASGVQVEGRCEGCNRRFWRSRVSADARIVSSASGGR